MSEKHDLLATSEKCAECDAIRAYDPAGLSTAREHDFAQDIAVAQAVRAAAGSENPVAWLRQARDDARIYGSQAGPYWEEIVDELDKLVNPAGGTS